MNKKPTKPKPWSQRATKESNALDLERGVFSKDARSWHGWMKSHDVDAFRKHGLRALLAAATAIALLGAGTANSPPMDVWYGAVDDNDLPLNPTWEYSHEGHGLPDAGVLCDHFPNRNGTLYVQSCTSQRPVVDEPRPFYGIMPNVRHLVCTYRRDRGDRLRPDSVHGHVNWGIVTYAGTMSFTGYGFPPFADGDWDWLLQTESDAGYVTSNDPGGIVAEFNGAEAAAKWTTAWWTGVRNVVTARHHEGSARAELRHLPAIVTGILGIDTKHVEHAEVHPIYALALRVAGDDDAQTWEFFVRNWGNEGGCSNEQHNFETSELSFFFPAHGARMPQVAGAEIRSTNAALSWGTAPARDGLVVTFQLAPPAAHSMDYGEMRLCYVSCSDVALDRETGGGYPMAQHDSIVTPKHRVLAPDEPRPLTRDVDH